MSDRPEIVRGAVTVGLLFSVCGLQASAIQALIIRQNLSMSALFTALSLACIILGVAGLSEGRLTSLPQSLSMTQILVVDTSTLLFAGIVYPVFVLRTVLGHYRTPFDLTAAEQPAVVGFLAVASGLYLLVGWKLSRLESIRQLIGTASTAENATDG